MPRSRTTALNSPLLEAKLRKARELRRIQAELRAIETERLRRIDVFAKLG
jgi:hypothetical protein